MRRYLLFFFLFLSCAYSKPQIYDCFLFFNELEILEVRLDELYNHVDHFVLVESVETFRGAPKPLYYKKNRERFKKYAKKIIHVVVKKERIPGENLEWHREKYQRNEIMKGLQKCSNNDIIIISDVDEILRGSDLKRYIAPILTGECKRISAKQKFYDLYMNRQRKAEKFWSGSVATKYRHLRKSSPEKIRSTRNMNDQIDDAGWHFSSMGGLNRFIYKVTNFCHYDEYPIEKQDSNFIYNRIQANYDLVSIDESYPRFIREHQVEFQNGGFIDYEGNPAYR